MAPAQYHAAIFEAAGIPCGLVGTVGYRIGDEMREATQREVAAGQGGVDLGLDRPAVGYAPSRPRQLPQAR